MSTGRSDYIYAGTQVLLNTLSTLPYVSIYLYPPFSSLSFPPGPVQVQMAICCTSPTACLSVLILVPNSLLNKEEKGERKEALSLFTNCSSKHKSLLNGVVKVPLEGSELEEVAQLLCQWALICHGAGNSQ